MASHTLASRRSRLSAVGLLSALLVAPLLAGCTSKSTAANDITIGACTADPSGGRPTVDGTIVNNSSKASTYLVDVNFFDSSGNKVSEGGATVGKVEAGASANFHAQGLQSAKGPLTCKLATVKRTVAP